MPTDPFETVTVPTITEDEIEAMLRAQGFGELSDDIDELMPDVIKTIHAEIAVKAADMTDQMYETLRAAMTGSADPEALKAALKIAERESATLMADMTKSEINKLGGVIKDGLEAGLHPHEIAKNLDMVKGLNKQGADAVLKHAEYLADIDPPLSDTELQKRLDKFYDKKLAERKKLIAHTETSIAQGIGDDIEARSDGKKFKSWMTVQDDLVSDHCEMNQAQGWIAIDKSFADGKMYTPAHPQCRCNTIYKTEVDKAARERATRRQQETASAKKAAAPATA